MGVDLQELRRLTQGLPPPALMSMVRRDRKLAPVEYAVNGTCIGFGLYNDPPHIAVQRAFMSANTVFPKHAHDTHEHLIVYIGQIVCCFEDEGEVSIGVGESIHIEPYVTHSIHALEDSWMVGVTIPAEEGYPDECQPKRLE